MLILVLAIDIDKDKGSSKRLSLSLYCEPLGALVSCSYIRSAFLHLIVKAICLCNEFVTCH